MKRKTWYTLAAAAGSLLVILLILLILAKAQGKAESPDPESRYPYTVRQTKRGLLVTLTGGESGCRWNAASDSPLSAYPVERSQTDTKSEVLICPVSDGSAAVTLTLENTAVPHNTVYQLTLRVQSENNEVTLLNAEHRTFPEPIQDENGRYSISAMSDGSYLVYMRDIADSQWVASLESGAADVRSYHPFWSSERLQISDTDPSEENTEQDICFCVSDSGGDAAVVSVSDRVQGDVLVLAFARGADGAFLLETHEIRAKNPASAEASAPVNWDLPVGAAIMESETVELFSQENGKPFLADSAYIFLSGEGWKLLRAGGQSRKALAVRDFRMSEDAPEGVDAAETDTPLWVFRVDGLWCGAWESGDTAYLLTAMGADRAVLEAVCEVLMEKQP